MTPRAPRYPVLLRDPRSSITAGAGNTAVSGWDPRTDAAATCATPDRSPPWYRVRHPTGNWRYVTLMLLGLVTVVLILLAFAARDRYRQPAIRLGMSALGLQVALTLVFWQFYI